MPTFLSRLRVVILLMVFTAPPGFAITPANRQLDLNYIATTLPQLDVNFFATLDPASYQQAVANLQSRIATATDPELYIGLAQLVALSGDMHTNLVPGGVFSYGTLPLSFVWLDDGLFIRAASPAYKQLIGT